MGVLARAYRSPMTTFMLIVLSTVFAGTEAWSETEQSFDLRRTWGVVARLTWVNTTADRSEIWFEELYGPFQLWDGEWWRIPLSAFHHNGFSHLFLNSLFLAVYGAILEEHWGSLRYACFLCGALLVSLLTEFLLEHYALGFSGVGCAIFGALCALRPVSPRIAGRLSPEHVAGMLTLLVILWLWTEIGVLSIANVAHLTGLVYGWLAGTVASTSWSRPWLAVVAFAFAHALLIGPYWLAMHPVWNGRYHWYLATRGPGGKPQNPADTDLLRKAVARDPSLSEVWILLGEDAQRQQRSLDGWRDVLRGLQHSPTNPDLLQAARKLWRRLAVTGDRAAAESAVTDAFGARANVWLKQFRRISPPPLLIAPDRPPRLPEKIEEELVTPEWTEAYDLWWWRADPTRTRPIPHDDPRSASEGELM